MPNSGPGNPTVEGPLAIRLLGTFQVSVGDRQIDADAWRLRKATQLVKLLALTPGHRLHRDQLIDALWPEVDPDSALSSFHQALHAARRAIEPDRAARSTQSMLRLHRQVLSLDGDDGLWIDIEAFQDAVQHIRATDDLASSLEALDLYSGDLLPEDLYESWTQHPRDLLRTMYLELLQTTARLQEAHGSTGDATKTLRTLIATDPLNESAYASLMRLHATSGRRDQAIRLYQQLSEMLRDELDAEPTDEVTALYERINAGEAVSVSTATMVPLQPSKPESSQELAGGRHITLIDFARQDELFNRLNEVEALQRAFDSLMNGKGQIVLLGGEPGIGKTRLAEELALYAAMSGASVLWARCHETEGSPAFWPWYQIVRQSLRDSYNSAQDLREDLGHGAGPIAQVVPQIRTLLPDTPVPPELDANQARFRFFDSLTSFLERLSQRVPLVLIMDDLHWADNSSLMMLEFLADEIASRRIMLLGNYREIEAGISLPFIRTLERLNRSPTTMRLYLRGFEMIDVGRFGSFIAGRPLPENLVETIYQRTNGNPFFTREVVQLLAREQETEDPRQWATALPVGVREAITLRLSHFSDDARQALTNAAVIGGEFRLSVLARVCDLPEDRLLDHLEEAISLGVITEVPGNPEQFRFAHILTQQTLYEGIIAARRARLHARVGSALEDLFASTADPPYAEIAHHFYLAASAGEAERAVTYLTKAGEQSMSRLAYSEAVDQFRRATEVIERYLPDRQSELFDLLLNLSRAQLASGESSDARSSRLRCVDIARAIADPERLALAALEMVNVSTDYVEWRAAEEIALLEEALAQLPPEHDTLQVQVMSALAVALVFDKSETQSADRVRRRERLAEHAVSMARDIETPTLLAEALLAAHDVLWTYEDVDERLAITKELLDIALVTHDPRLEMVARAQQLGEFLVKGHIAEADRELDAYETLATTYQLPVNVLSAMTKRAMRAFMRGAFDESERLMERARDIGQRSAPEVSRLTYLMQLFFIRREQDRLQEVEELLTSEATNHPGEAFWQCLLAAYHADLGEEEQASKLIAELLNPDNPIPRDSFWLASLALLAGTSATLNDANHAAVLVDLLQSHKELFVFPGNRAAFLGPVSHYLGLLSTTLERWDDALTYFDHALNAEQLAGTPVYEAHTNWARAVAMSKQAGQNSLAQQFISNVLDACSQVGLPRLGRLAANLQSDLEMCRSP